MPDRPSPGTAEAHVLALKMYEAYLQGDSKSSIEERFLGSRLSHGKMFSAWVRRELGIETESKHPLIAENERLRRELERTRSQPPLDLEMPDDGSSALRRREPADSGPLRSLHVLRFRSLLDVHLVPSNLTCLIGANGAGKSNLISALRLIQNAVEEDLETAVSRMGGAEQIYAGGPEGDDSSWPGPPVGTEQEAFEFRLEYKPGHRAATEYQLRVSFDELGRAVTQREYLRLKRSPGPGRRRVFLEVTDGRGFAFNEAGEQREKFVASDPGTLALRALGFLEDQPEISEFRRYIESWTFLSADPAAMREPTADQRVTRLSHDGANLAPLLRTLERSRRDVLDDILEDMRLFYPDLVSLEPTSERGLAFVEVKESPLGRQLPLSLLSDGFLFFLAISTAVRTAEPGALVVVEEPEHGLHPAALPVLVELFRGRSDTNQVLLTTHSPRLVDLLWPDEVAVVTRVDGRTAVERLDNQSLERWLNRFSLGEIWTHQGLGDVTWYASD